MTVDVGSTGSLSPPLGRLTLGTSYRGTPAGEAQLQQIHEHEVAFYETDAYLTESVVAHLLPALAGADAAVVIATPEHRAQFAAALEAEGISIDVELDRGRLVMLDAADTLELFMDGDLPDADRFRDVISRVIAAAAAGSRHVRAYGEMVALLWQAGQVHAAIALEDLWNDLAQSHRFSLFCAYPAAAFEREGSTESFRTVCSQHSRVTPSESFTALAAPDDQLRAVALLQQVASAGASERHALQRKQRQLEATLQRLREIDEMRNEFVAMVVHDIRSPAVVVRGYLNLLAETFGQLDESQIRELLGKSLENVRQVERLADDMTTVSRLESGTFDFTCSAFSLTGLVHRVADDIRMSSGRAIDTTDVAAQPRVIADERRQAQVLTNLLTNAVKFSPPTGRISIALERREREVVVRVRDEGVGLSAAEVERLFRPFSRLPRSDGRQVKGSGLGLYITKALIEGQGGSIWVESEPGAGSTFAYSVPRASSQ